MEEEMPIYAKCACIGCTERARDNSKYCSKACSIKQYNQTRPRKPKKIGKCEACGTTFIGRFDRTTCSSTCRSRIHRARIKKAA